MGLYFCIFFFLAGKASDFFPSGMINLRFSSVVECMSNSFLGIAFIWVFHHLFFHLPVGGYLELFPVFEYSNKAAIMYK